MFMVAVGILDMGDSVHSLFNILDTELEALINMMDQVEPNHVTAQKRVAVQDL